MSTNPNSNPNQNLQQRNKKRFNFTWIYLIIGVILMAIYLFGGSNNAQTKEIDDVQFKKMVLDKEIKELMYTQKDQKIYLFLKEKSVETKADYKDLRDNLKGPQYYLNISDYKVFNDNLNIMIEEQVDEMMQESTIRATKSKKELKDGYVFPMKQDTSKDWGTELIWWMLPILLIFVFFYFSMRSMRGGGAGGGGLFSIGKSKAQLFDEKSTLNISFKDVAGMEGAKYEVEEIVDFLKNPQKYTELGGKIPRGALLVGPPGTGKTLLARAVAGEAKVPFFSLSGSDFVEMFVGVGASRVRDLFKTAKEKAPCIIFIDEIDAIGRARGKNLASGSNDERENTLNQLLTEMDGFGTNAGVIILAATNRADVLDKALLRAGRFDRQIYVELPEVKERKAIFKVHMKDLKYDKNDVNINFLAKQTPGFSGADIANICNEAALIAARHSKKLIGKQDFLDAVDRIIGGLEKKSKIISPNEKRRIAYHEAGHASVSWLLEYANPLLKVTIVPRGQALGAAWYVPEERQITTKGQMMDQMISLLGGRASEEVVFGEVSTGALNDLERATKQAFAMVTYYGLDKEIGNLSYYDSSGQSEYSFQKPYSEKTSETIDKQVKAMIEQAYQTAKTILVNNREKLDELAKILVEREVIFREDVEKIYGKRPWDEDKIDEINDNSKEIIEEDKEEKDNQSIDNQDNKEDEN